MDYSYFPMIHLPAELKRRTASYLCPYDALRLSETCHNLHSSLSLRLLSDSRQLFTRQRFTPTATNGDDVLPWVRIPCLSRRVHSITVTFHWRDQGWGHRKGQIWIVGSSQQRSSSSSSDPVESSALPFHGGRVVSCKLTFSTCSMEGETYQMWYRVGGGGGHQLMLSDGKIHTVIFDDEAGNFSRNYKILKDVGAIAVHPEAELPRPQSTFYPQLLLRVSQFIRLELALRRTQRRQKNNEQDAITTDDNHVVLSNPLVAFFQMFRIPVTEDSLSAVEEILQCESDEQASTQETSVPPAPPAEEGGFLDDFRELLMGVGMELIPGEGRRVLRLNMQPIRAEIEVQQVLHDDDDDDDDDDMSDDTTDGGVNHNDIEDDEEEDDHEMNVDHIDDYEERQDEV